MTLFIRKLLQALSRQRFVVIVHGSGFAPDRERVDPAPEGFFTSRIVDARSEEEAVDTAIAEVLRDERLVSIQLAGAAPRIVAEDVYRVPIWYKRIRRPRGFTFYTEEEEPPADSLQRRPRLD